MKKQFTQNRKIFQVAKKYLVGGVDSPVRSFNYVGMDPLIIKKGKGAYLYDYDGNKYIDYVLSWGAAILGHADPGVVRDIHKTLKKGSHFGTTTFQEIELAKTIQAAIPFIKKIRFVNSGTEAIMGAVRLARGYTGRDFILKFENAYHGHADYLLAKAGSGLATFGIPSSRGVPKDFVKYTLVAPFNDWGAVEQIFRKYGQRLAAVLIEPVGGNYGVTPPDSDFLTKLRQITKRYGVLLISDEVITGFRFRYGSAGEMFHFTPDLIALGKIIGGGLPIGAYGGKEEVMRCLAPLGDVYQASTFSGNPVVMQAGLSTLKVLEKSKDHYARIKELTKRLVFALKKEGQAREINLKTSYFGTMFSIRFQEKSKFRKFYQELLKKGIYFAPSEFEANFLSFAHSYQDVDKTITAVKLALDQLKK